ncbi:MAG: Hpt domain-containing protein [Campylobacterota bacterium]|nr:Hpt domain-containing protein [Campylobacterota bacterium]
MKNTETDNLFNIDATIKSIRKAQEKMQFSTSIIKRLLTTFIDSSSQTMQLILNDIEKNDINAMRMNAHAIRGSALSLMLDDIVHLANQLEYDSDINYYKIGKLLQDHINALEENKDLILTALEKNNPQ